MRKYVYRPLRKMAQATGAAVDLPAPLQQDEQREKSDVPARRLHRQHGRRSFCFGIGYHPEDTDKPRRERRRLFTTIKNNYNPDHGLGSSRLTPRGGRFTQ